ncbi:MAG: CRISPR system precrRNA processing endoribonuclease RAMP protein Cas6, partial [Gammaproteobacteria bacterium]
GGLLGQITYRGDLSPFLPWLALGEWMHIGGKTSFGLGRYTIEPPRQGTSTSTDSTRHTCVPDISSSVSPMTS